MVKNHFDYVPEVVGKKRSVFPYNQPVSGSYEMGRLYPLDVIEVRPGSTFSLDIAGVVRSGTLVRPLMDDIIVDIGAFFVKNRISWTHWEQFLGSNDDVAFTQTNEYVKPYITYYGLKSPVSSRDDAYSPAFRTSTGTFAGEMKAYNNTLACHFGLPVMPSADDINAESGDQYTFKFDALWVRGFYRIYNEFWRDENLMDPILFSLTDTGASGEVMGRDGLTPVPATSGPSNSIVYDWQLGYCPKVCKLKDYFTSATPSPVRAVSVPAIPVDSGFANITAASSLHNMSNPLKLGNVTGSVVTDDYAGQIGLDAGAVKRVYASGFDEGNPLNRSNLIVNLANTSSIAISKMRDAILLNRLYENRLRIGGRYPEILQGEFGVKKQIDDRAQILIHKRFNIAVSEVVSTAQTDVGGATVNAVGDLGGMSKTPIKSSLFTASFDEDGLIFITLCIRQRKHTYVQGWAKKFYRETWLDYYWPSLNGTSDVAIEKQELVALWDKLIGTTYNKQVFGYQEYGADEKVQFARSVGYLNPQLKGAIQGWNLADVYSTGALNYPVLDKKFLAETPDNFARDLVISDLDLAPQFIGDFLIYGTARKVMPVYNIPGIGGVL